MTNIFLHLFNSEWSTVYIVSSVCKNNSTKNKFLKLLYFEAFLANFLEEKK